MALTKNKAVLEWIDHMAAMTQPDQIVWIDGSEAQLEDCLLYTSDAADEL